MKKILKEKMLIISTVLLLLLLGGIYFTKKSDSVRVEKMEIVDTIKNDSVIYDSTLINTASPDSCSISE